MFQRSSKQLQWNYCSLQKYSVMGGTVWSNKWQKEREMMQTVISSTSWSKLWSRHLELKKVSVKRKAKSLPSLDLWRINCCTNTEIPCIHHLKCEITFRWSYGTSKTSCSYATQYGWGQWLPEEQYFIYMEAQTGMTTVCRVLEILTLLHNIKRNSNASVWCSKAHYKVTRTCSSSQKTALATMTS